jgi:hypothetical protein
MEINVMKYSEWRETAVTLHLLLQMMGKVKLSRMEPQPEWGHVLLNLTADGFSTGLIPNGDESFQIDLLLRESRMRAIGVDGRESAFSIGGNTPMNAYYREFQRMLSDVMCDTDIYTTPQEMSVKTPFDEDETRRFYDVAAAQNFFRMCVFAYEGIYRFLSPFRGKRFLPSFFWGTFDTTGVLFSGKEAPWQGEGVIEAGAFDEEMMEFGFWPGDDAFDEPAFYILTYPFPSKDYSDTGIRPDKAWFGTEKSEFFLKLRDLMTCDDPKSALNDFFASGYELFSRGEGWSSCEWMEKPLLYDKGSCKLRSGL